jgi:membrane protein YdbS with pleckstrin-like domain
MEVRSLRQGPSHRIRPARRLLFVLISSLAWIGLVAWLTIPYLDDIGESTTVPVAVALIAGLGIIPGVLELQSISLRIFSDEVERPPER